MGQKDLRMEDQMSGFVRKQDVAKGGELEPKVNVFKLRVKSWRRGEETNVTQTYHRRGSGSEARGYERFFENFRKILEK